MLQNNHVIPKETPSFLRNLRVGDLAAGCLGGVVSSLVVHPLDLIKIRLAVNDGLSSRPLYDSLKHTCKSILKNEGVRGFYKGVTPNLLGAGLSWGFYFFFYNAIKEYMGNGNKFNLSPFQHMLASAQAGSLTLLLTNPVWVCKTRLCLQYSQTLPITSKSTVVYKGFIDCLKQIYLTEGVRGLYKGLLPGLFGVSHGMVQFTIYEEMKKWYWRNHEMSNGDVPQIPMAWIFCFSSSSKMLAALATYPYQVVRTRLQDQHRSYGGTLEVMKFTWRNEGALGFYKGLTPSLLRVVPATCVTFIVYEKMKQYQEYGK